MLERGSAGTIETVEAGPRDGPQNEERVLAPDVRAAFIHKLMDAGAKRVEAVSFVHANGFRRWRRPKRPRRWSSAAKGSR